MVLCTGGTGFIGRALLRRLADSQGPTIRASVRARCSHLPDSVEQRAGGDLSATTDWTSALLGVDVVVHLAGRAHVLRERAADPLPEFRRVNVDCTLNLARQAAHSGTVRRFVFVSSVGVNGNTTIGTPFTEADPPCPQEAYAISKHEGEQALRQLAAETGMDVVIVRPPLVYGPNAPGNFGRLCRLVRTGYPLPFGATHNRRSLVALDNLVDFLVTCLDHPAAAGETFLVSDGEDLSTGDLVGRLARAMGRRPYLLPVPVALLMGGGALLGKRELTQRLLGSLQVDISKARRILGWVPPFSIDEGLRRTAAPQR